MVKSQNVETNPMLTIQSLWLHSRNFLKTQGKLHLYAASLALFNSDNIRVTLLVQAIVHPANQNANGTIVTGTLRTVFSF